MKSSAIAVIVIIIAIAIVAAVAYMYSGTSYSNVKTTYTSTSTMPYGQPTTSIQSTVVNNSTSQPVSSNASSLNGKTTQYNVKMSYASSVGNYLANGTGWTLYTFSKDKQYGNSSSCTGTCAEIWPAFHVANLSIQQGLNVSMFGTIVGSNNSIQLTYNGYPLYYYSGDKKPGDLNGQGYLGLWYVISPSGVKVT